VTKKDVNDILEEIRQAFRSKILFCEN
jgi:hypothetical protein